MMDAPSNGLAEADRGGVHHVRAACHHDCVENADGEAQDDGSSDDVAGAYERLGISRGLLNPVADQFSALGKHLQSEITGMLSAEAELKRAAARTDQPNPLLNIPRPALDYSFDDSTQRTASATERTASLMSDMHAVTLDLVRLTKANLDLSRQQQESARQTERFTRRMTWTATGIAVASLGTAIVALFVRT